MAKDKEKRQLNPATAALKAAKTRTITKQKAAVAAQRTERLAQRNPHSMRRQIAELQQQREASASGALTAREQRRLEELERDLVKVERAREKGGAVAAGSEKEGADGKGTDGKRDVRAEQRARRQGVVLGKREREDVNGFQAAHKRARTPESATDDEARHIPMPHDVHNMPPIPRRRPQPHQHSGTAGTRLPHVLPDRPGSSSNTSQGTVPTLPAQTVYASAPQIRDLRKEAVARFVPAAVASKLAAVRGEAGKLLEPEEADALEAVGYAAGGSGAGARVSSGGGRTAALDAGMDEAVRGAADEAGKEAQFRMMAREAEEGVPDSLDEEARRFEQELRTVEMEEVSDEDL